MKLLVHTTLILTFGMEAGRSADRNLRDAALHAPTSFADIHAKFQQMQENTKNELQKLTSFKISPSTFIQEANGKDNTYDDLDAKLKAIQERTKAQLAKISGETASPSSFIEEGAPDSFADLDAKLKALEEKTKAELAKLQSDTAAPSSFVEEGTPDSFADIDAKLKALEEKTKAELAKLQSDTAAPSSFVEESDAENPGSALLHLIHDGGAEHIKERATEEASHAVQLKEATSQDLAARHMAFIEGLKGIAEPLKSRLGKKIAEEDEERKHTEEELSRMRSERAADSLASSFLQENDGEGMHGFTGFHGRRYKEQSEEMKDEEAKAEEAEAGVDKIRHKLAEQLKAAQAGVDQFGEELKDADSAPTTSRQLDQLRKELKSRA